MPPAAIAKPQTPPIQCEYRIGAISGKITSGKETSDGLAILADNTGLGINFKTAHGVVEDGGHDGNVEEVVHRPFTIGKELTDSISTEALVHADRTHLLAERILLRPHASVVVIEGFLQGSG